MRKRFGLGLRLFFFLFLLFRYSASTAKSQAISPYVVPLDEFPLLVRLGILYFFIFFLCLSGGLDGSPFAVFFVPLPGKGILVHLALGSVI